jgi:hypothetical protein
MTKFKKGDRVRNLVADGFLEVGDVGTVMKVVKRCLLVKWDHKIWMNRDDKCYAQIDYQLELIPKLPRLKSFLIWLMGGKNGCFHKTQEYGEFVKPAKLEDVDERD